MQEKCAIRICQNRIYTTFAPGELAERSIAAVLKTVEVLQPPGVRIPNSPLQGTSHHKYGLSFFHFRALPRQTCDRGGKFANFLNKSHGRNCFKTPVSPQ